MAREQRPSVMVAMACRIGSGMAAALIIGLGGGLLIDRWLGTGPWGLVVMVLLGVVAAGADIRRAIGGLGAVPETSDPRQPRPAVKTIDGPSA